MTSWNSNTPLSNLILAKYTIIMWKIGCVPYAKHELAPQLHVIQH